MKKITLEVPDWVEGKHLYLMAGIELVAYKYLKQPWKIKTSRCNMCGKCCMNFKNDSKEIKNGRCIYLKQNGKKYVCSLGVSRPWRCSVAAMPKNIPGCTEKFKDQE